MKRFNFGFTLAETLITLGIIGVVAAITIGVLITNVSKEKTGTSLKSFFSVINQAMLYAYANNGDKPELPRSDYTYAQNVAWLYANLLPYMRYSSVKNCNDPNQYRRNAACVKLENGSMFEFVVDYNGADFLYFPDGKWASIENNKFAQRQVFAFQFSKRAKANDDSVIQSTDFVEPYIYKWNNKEKDLYDSSEYGCKKGKKKFYCAKILQLNGWEMPFNYPW